MNKIYSLSVITLIFLSAFQLSSSAQTSVTSTTGYTVTLNVYPSAIIPVNGTSCNNGYNYNVKMNYNITISGPNAPASMYTLQGTIGCGSDAIFFDLPNNGGSGNVLSSRAWTSRKDCASPSVSALGCQTVKIQIEGPGISSRTLTYSGAAAASPLGIKLSEFSATLENTRVKIKWATASEENNEYFSIERSTDGTQWNEVKRVKGAGNSTSVLTYEAYDNAPVAGTNFYRLKQTDFDGKTSLSDIQVVKYTSTGKSISVFPVPNAGNTITITGIANYSNYEFTLLNANGNVVYTSRLSQSSVNLPQLQSGVYVIRLKDKASGEAQNMRYVKI